MKEGRREAALFFRLGSASETLGDQAGELLELGDRQYEPSPPVSSLERDNCARSLKADDTVL